MNMGFNAKSMNVVRNGIILSGIALLSVSCGGSSGGGAESALPIGSGSALNDITENLEYNACESSYYQNIIGTYAGTLDYEFVLDGDSSIRACVFDAEILITGSPRLLFGPGGTTVTSTGCDLSSSYTGSVEQSLVFPADDESAYQCVASQGMISLSDPNQSVPDPETFYENIVYPVTMRASGEFTLPRNGPYFLNPDVVVPYINFIGSAAPLVEFFIFTENGGLELFVEPLGSLSENSLLIESNFTKEQ